MPNRSENPEEVAKYLERQAMTKPLIDQAVDRFLGWKLPEDFHPDAGISFKPFFNEGTPYQMKHNPIGTNLLHAGQAKAMLEYVTAPLLERVSELNRENDDLIARLSNETASKGEIIYQRDEFKRVNIEQATLILKLRYAAQLAADWINNDFIDVTDNEDGTSTVDDSQIETAHAKGEAIKQALLDALN